MGQLYGDEVRAPEQINTSKFKLLGLGAVQRRHPQEPRGEQERRLFLSVVMVELSKSGNAKDTIWESPAWLPQRSQRLRKKLFLEGHPEKRKSRKTISLIGERSKRTGHREVHPPIYREVNFPLFSDALGPITGCACSLCAQLCKQIWLLNLVSSFR